MQLIRDIAGMKKYTRDIHAAGETIALVPTMGYLHKGHQDLMRMGAGMADHLVISIFVNPAQFGENEDLDQYPRDLQRDMELAESVGVECIFFPDNAMMYPKGYSTYIQVEGISHILCGQSRPIHFRGVATIVAKLFNIISPDIAVFGQKDYQQLVIIQRMVDDLNMDVRIIGHPIVREHDGLAMSSRNKYLSASQRKDALVLHQALEYANNIFSAGTRDVKVLKQEVTHIIKGCEGCIIDYVEISDARSLEPLEVISRDKAVIALAVRVGETRLIDNMVLEA
ncbi:MAG: pantoate--beta-alanine ligase [Thermodesulfobacteriota bacterium]|nr:pantoate--beta-alanine ligase [Thermodesulfobacteriota bacterium]